jgi:aminoglycoside/choline kinase family phosphotransferase
MEKLLELYKQWSGAEPQNVEPLPGAGSNREYYRMADAEGHTVVGCIGTSRDENHAFVYLCGHFMRRQLPVPKILAVSNDELRYLQTDLGSVSLFDAIRGGREAGGRYTLKEQELLRRTIRELPNIQIRGARDLDFSNCYPQPVFNTDSVLFDLNYFKYCFLKATELDFHELKLEADFRLLAKDLTEAGDEQAFLYRDFQARNVMLTSPVPSREGESPTGNMAAATSSPLGRSGEVHPYFIDFQGGRRGPYYYDLASFLWQASAKYPHKLRRELVYEYYNALKQFTEVPAPHAFVERLSLFVLFRQLQVLGAYGFRGYFERKAHFIESIPPAMHNIRELLSERNFPYPYLTDLLTRLASLPQYQQIEAAASRADGYKTTNRNPYKPHPQDGPATFSKYDAQGPLVVRVFSFSYGKGIPADESGNGGGYVFDCRSTHNPGRYEPYKQLTGLDEPVIRFLEDDGEILTFLDSVYKLADAHVRRYIQRGFTSLMFCFGCTGGQHRSVYSAQHLAEHIHEKFGIEVRICHREQNITQILKNT